MVRARVAGLVLLGGAAAAASFVAFAATALPHSDLDGAQELAHKAWVPAVASDGPLPDPTATPVPERGRVTSVRIDAIGVRGTEGVEIRDTVLVGGKEQFQEPSNPANIAYYPRFSFPGKPGANVIVSAHINYVTGVLTPFRNLQKTPIGTDVFVTYEDGSQFRYTVKTNQTVGLATLSNGGMDAVVYPQLAADRERITLISCGGDFIPFANGPGGSYASRVIVTAERVMQ